VANDCVCVLLTEIHGKYFEHYKTDEKFKDKWMIYHEEESVLSRYKFFQT
jgi:hypothetical protein